MPSRARARPRVKSARPKRKIKSTRPQRTTFRIVYTPELLALLRHEFENTPKSLLAIATPHGFSRRTLADKAAAEGWVRYRRPALDVSPAAKLDARLAQMERAPAALMNSNSAPPAASDFNARFASAVEAVLEEVAGLIAAVKAARVQMQETGRYAQAAALGRDLNAITNVLYRARRMQAGATDGALPDDDVPTDLDAQRDELARTIDALVAEWLHAQNAAGDAPAPAPPPQA
jgi:hypothetical protein